jgi:hypothetical protein
MKNIGRKRFQLQLLFALIAAVSVAALTIDLVANAVRHAESFVLADTNKTLRHALSELDREYELRRHDGSSWSDLSSSAQDLTLRAISQAVLMAYPGVEGGSFVRSQFLGYSYPTHDGGSPKIDVPGAEKPVIEAVLRRATAGGESHRVLRGRRDFVVISAVPARGTDGTIAVWAMKRLPGQAEPAQHGESFLLAGLVSAALLGAAGVLATGIGLNRGVAQITRGLEPARCPARSSYGSPETVPSDPCS